MVPPTESQRRDLFAGLEARTGHRSTVCTSQLPVDAWHAQRGDPTLADALLDRLVHSASRLVLKGPPRRTVPRRYRLSALRPDLQHRGPRLTHP